MEKKNRKSSLKISLALIGSVAFASCSEDGYRHIYNSASDCGSEWGSGSCESISSDSPDYRRGRYYGPFMRSGSMISRPGFVSRSSGITSVTRGGFGSSSMSHGSSRS